MIVPFSGGVAPAVTMWRAATGLLIAFVLQTFSGYSQPVGNWTFTGNLSGTGNIYNTVSAASLGPAIVSGVQHGSSEYYGENGWPSGTLNANAYLQFSLTPNAGRELNLTNMVFRMRRSSTGTAGAGPTQWTLRSSRDGYTANVATGTLSSAYLDYPVVLSGFSHIYTAITFRLYGHNAVISSGGINRLVWDNISVYGLIGVLASTSPLPVVPVPERPLIDVTVKGSVITTAIEAPANDQYTIMVHNTSGLLLQKQQVTLKAGSNNIGISSNGMAHGVYVLSLYGKRRYGSRKFVY